MCDARAFFPTVVVFAFGLVNDVDVVGEVVAEGVVGLLGVIGGDGGVLLKRSAVEMLSSEEDKPESLETEMRSSMNNGDMDGIVFGWLLIGFEDRRGTDKSNGESGKE